MKKYRQLCELNHINMNYIFYLIKKITVKLALKPATDSFVYIDNLHALFYMAMKKNEKKCNKRKEEKN